MSKATRRHGHRAELRGDWQRQALIVPEFAVVIVTPCPGRSVALHGQAGIETWGNELPVRGRSHLRGDVATGHHVIEPLPELTVQIAPPGPQRAICLDRHGIGATSHERLPAGRHANLGRNEVLYECAIAQLAAAVQAPRPKRAVRMEAGGEIGPGGDAGPIGGDTDLDRGSRVRGGAVAKLAVAVDAPGPEVAAGIDSEGEVTPGTEALAGEFPVGEHTHLHGCGMRAGVRRTLTKLAAGVASPAPESAVGFNSHGVIRAGNRERPGGPCADLHRAGTGGGGTVAHLP